MDAPESTVPAESDERFGRHGERRTALAFGHLRDAVGYSPDARNRPTPSSAAGEGARWSRGRVAPRSHAGGGPEPALNRERVREVGVREHAGDDAVLLDEDR